MPAPFTKRNPMSVEDACFTLLRHRRYPPDRYVIVRGVGESTGGIPGRRCDGIAVSCWPKDGFLLDGVEVKASRADLLRELRQPDKADALKRYCDHWWLVVPDLRVLGGDWPSVVPEEWGILWADFVNRRVDVIHEARPLDPLPMSRQFAAALVRAASSADRPSPSRPALSTAPRSG